MRKVRQELVRGWLGGRTCTPPAWAHPSTAHCGQRNSAREAHPECHGQALGEVESEGVQDHVQVVVDDVGLRLGASSRHENKGAASTRTTASERCSPSRSAGGTQNTRSPNKYRSTPQHAQHTATNLGGHPRGCHHPQHKSTDRAAITQVAPTAHHSMRSTPARTCVGTPMVATTRSMSSRSQEASGFHTDRITPARIRGGTAGKRGGPFHKHRQFASVAVLPHCAGSLRGGVVAISRTVCRLAQPLCRLA